MQLGSSDWFIHFGIAAITQFPKLWLVNTSAENSNNPVVFSI